MLEIIDDAINEALADEQAEREVKRAMESKVPYSAKPPVNNTVTIPLDDYLSLYCSTEKYCRLLALIAGMVEPCTYSDGIRLKNSESILEFLKYSEFDVYAGLLEHVEKERGGDL